MEFGESRILKLSNHVKDNVIKEVVDKKFQSFDLKLERSIFSHEWNLTNKNMDMVNFDKSPKSIFKDYLEVLLYSKVEVLEDIYDDDIYDDEVKLEEKNV